VDHFPSGAPTRRRLGALSRPAGRDRALARWRQTL